MVIGTSTKALVKGIDTWKKETIMKKVNIIYFFELSLYCLLLYSKSTMLLNFQEAAQMLESGSTPGGKCLQTFSYYM